MKERKVDAYIQESYINGEREYNMWIHYNGVDFALLSRDREAGSFAQYFKRKMMPVTHNTEGMLFTDTSGWTISSGSNEALLAGVKGLENIDRSLMSLISASTNLDIQSDLIIHVGNEEFALVRTVDGKEYKPNDTLGLSKKGLSFGVLAKLDQKIASLPEETKKHIK